MVWTGCELKTSRNLAAASAILLNSSYEASKTNRLRSPGASTPALKRAVISVVCLVDSGFGTIQNLTHILVVFGSPMILSTLSELGSSVWQRERNDFPDVVGAYGFRASHCRMCPCGESHNVISPVTLGLKVCGKVYTFPKHSFRYRDVVKILACSFKSNPNFPLSSSGFL